MKLNDLKDLLIDQMNDLYDAEHQILDALPKMIDKSSNDDLKKALRQHRRETERQVERLEKAYGHLDTEPKRAECKGMKGIIAEGEEMISSGKSDHTRDAAIIAAAQHVEHYEMAGYGCARTYANRLDVEEIPNLLQETLSEEKEADQKLTGIAENVVNPQAAAKV